MIGVTSSAALNAQSIGFAIPVSRALPIAESLQRHGKVDHSFIGLQVKAISDGLLVVNVVPASPAADAGILSGDVIQKIDDTPADTVSSLFDYVDSVPVGRPITFLVQRNAENFAVTVVTTDLQDFIVAQAKLESPEVSPPDDVPPPTEDLPSESQESEDVPAPDSSPDSVPDAAPDDHHRDDGDDNSSPGSPPAVE